MAKKKPTQLELLLEEIQKQNPVLKGTGKFNRSLSATTEDSDKTVLVLGWKTFFHWAGMPKWKEGQDEKQMETLLKERFLGKGLVKSAAAKQDSYELPEGRVIRYSKTKGWKIPKAFLRNALGIQIQETGIQVSSGGLFALWKNGFPVMGSTVVEPATVEEPAAEPTE